MYELSHGAPGSMQVSWQNDAKVAPRAGENNLPLLVLLLDFSKDCVNSHLSHRSEIQAHLRVGN